MEAVMSYTELSLLEFQQRFATEEACQEALEKARWPQGFVCPRCGHGKACRLGPRNLLQCSACRRQASVTAGTVFHKTHTPLVKWFWAIWMVAQDKGGVSALRLARQLELRYRTAWTMLHKLRKAMGQRDATYTLTGSIEMDDAFFGGAAAGKRGRGAANKTNEKLPWVHIAISNSKRFLLGPYHGVSHKYLQAYLDEFCYRFNRRAWEPTLTARLLTACLVAKPVTLAERKAYAFWVMSVLPS